MMNTKELIETVKNERGSAFQNCNDCEYGTHNGEVIEKLNFLAELEDKIENGTVIELPCKVGDTVYKVEREYGYSNDTYFWNIVEKQFELGMLDYLWGKMIFLTREEAEQRLLELQGETKL